MHSSKQKKIKFHALKHALSFKPEIRIQSNFHAFINALFKYKKKSNFMYSNMHFHSNSKFKFNQKFHSFINAPFKKKQKKSNFMHSNMHFQNSYSIKNFHAFINASSKKSNFMHSYMNFSKITKSKIHIQTNFMYFNMHSFKKNHISCIRKCIL